jgi:hypothetical protein
MSARLFPYPQKKNSPHTSGWKKDPRYFFQIKGWQYLTICAKNEVSSTLNSGERAEEAVSPLCTYLFDRLEQDSKLPRRGVAL